MVLTQQLDYLYLRMPGTEPVTLTTSRGQNDDAVETVSITHAWMREVSRKDIQRGLVTSAREGIVWNIPNILLAGSEIKPGDSITDSNSVSWKVEIASRIRLQTHWRCICRRQK